MIRLLTGRLVIVLIRIPENQYIVPAPERVVVNYLGENIRVRIVRIRLPCVTAVEVPDWQICNNKKTVQTLLKSRDRRKGRVWK